MKAFHEHEIQMTVNTIPVLGTIDRSGDDEIVVHFLQSYRFFFLDFGFQNSINFFGKEYL